MRGAWKNHYIESKDLEIIIVIIIIIMNKLQEFPILVSQRLAGPRNVSVDLKYDVLCL